MAAERQFVSIMRREGNYFNAICIIVINYFTSQCTQGGRHDNVMELSTFRSLL